jgi:hypothetical protein
MEEVIIIRIIMEDFMTGKQILFIKNNKKNVILLLQVNMIKLKEHHIIKKDI